MRKRCLKFVVIMLFVFVAYCSTYTVLAHNANLFTLEIWNEESSNIIQGRNWYYPEGNHIPEILGTSTNKLKYYISQEGYGSESDVNWSNIQKSIEESMLKWNDVYFRDNGVDKRLVYLEKTNNINEANVVVYPSALKKAGVNDNYDYSYINDGTYISNDDVTIGATFEEEEGCFTVNVGENGSHSHCTKYRIIINIREIFLLTRTYKAKFENLMKKLGSHEMGHVLGLYDIEEAGRGETYPELIMANGANILAETLEISYQDVVGVAIYRGLHTDADHEWLIEEYNGQTRYRCKICNGWTYEAKIGYFPEYGHDTPTVDSHVHTEDDMMIVCMIKYPDNSDHFHYFQKCKYCSYVECVSNNYVVDSKDNFLHTCTCQDCGYQWTQVHIYHFIYTSRSIHDARCKVCNHFGEYANHTYEYYVYDDETHNMNVQYVYLKQTKLMISFIILH